MAPTAHNVALDRPDLQYTTSVLMRTLETRLKLKAMQWMKLASCINAVPELRWDAEYQEMPGEVYVEVTAIEQSAREHEDQPAVVWCSGASAC